MDYYNLLAEYVAHKSISTDPQYTEDIKSTVTWLRSLFEKNHFQVDVFEGHGNPILFAEKLVDPTFQTVLVYGHYDVQPAEKDDGWDSNPFEVKRKNGKVFGRGVVDNKGQNLIHIYSVLELLQKGGLKYNVKFLLEGDEETGGRGVGDLLAVATERFKCDHILISDGEMPYRPMITASFRGTYNFSVKYKSANNNLHSGLYGGASPNAGIELARLVSNLVDESGNTSVTGFYEKDKQVTNHEIELAKALDSTRENVLKHSGMKKLMTTDMHNSFSAKTGFKSMLTLSGFKTGYVGEGYSNIVPATAEAKFNVRIAAGQDPHESFELVKKYILESTPEYIECEVVAPTTWAYPIKVDLSSDFQKSTIQLLKEVYEDEVLVDYCGATIPVVTDFQNKLGVDPVLVSLANDDCNMHGVNENFNEGLIEKGLEFSKRFFSKG